MSRFDITLAQPAAWSILSRSYQAGKIASTYLFYGQEGVGHWPLAIAAAALFNCLEPLKTGDPDRPVLPCGECRNCRMIYDLNFEGLSIAVPIPPHKKLEEAIDLTAQYMEEKKAEPFKRLVAARQTSIPIAMAREFASRLSRKSAGDIMRVVLFYQMEKMRQSSADALLKLIEEPPPDTVIILTAEKPEMLLPTIQSRSQKIRLTRMPEAMIVEYLQEHYELSESRATLITRLADGVPGRAIDLVATEDDDQLSRRSVGLLLFKSIFSESGPQLVAHMQEMVNDRDRSGVEDLLHLWLSLLRDCHYFAATGDEEKLTNVDFVGEIQRLSTYFADLNLADAMAGAIKNTLADFRRNVHIQTALAALLLRLQSKVSTAG